MLPAELAQVTNAWLDDVDEALAEIDVASRGFDTVTGAKCKACIADVTERITRLRAVLVGEADIENLVESWSGPLHSIDREIAERLNVAVQNATRISPDVIQTAHSLLVDAAQRKSFLLQVGDIAGTAFLNFGRYIWDTYPELAPADYQAARNSKI